MSEPLSNEALAALLKEMTGPRAGADEIDPDTVAALVREVQQQRAKVRTLEADNAALLSVVRTYANGLGDGGCCECRRIGHHTLACETGKADRKPHPGAALLAERDTLRARVTVAEERASVLTTERNALLEQVRSLTEERDGLKRDVSDVEKERVQQGDRYVEKLDSIRARMAELERAATIARDAALEEAARCYEAWEKENCQLDSPTPEKRIRALKSQPGKRFVDAEEVRDVLDFADQGLRNAINYGLPLKHHQEAVEELLERLTLDGETP